MEFSQNSSTRFSLEELSSEELQIEVVNYIISHKINSESLRYNTRDKSAADICLRNETLETLFKIFCFANAKISKVIVRIVMLLSLLFSKMI